jgi:hypothetical protein
MESTVSGLDDVELVYVMLGLLAPTEDEYGHAPMYGGRNENGAMTTRVVFAEIALRWLPPATFGEAFAMIAAGPDLTALDGGGESRG